MTLQVAQRLAQLSEDARRVGLRVVTALDDRIEELASGRQLHDEVDAPARVERLVQPQNVGVAQHRHDCNLCLHLGE